MSTEQKYFTRQLLHWHEHANRRSLPWKQEKDPYKIWLSEVILQQTRAEQGLPYYLRFTTAYPSVCDLAHAPEEQVFRLWQGLGYYNRCKNMLATARYICAELNGVFPATYDSLLSLKGIGPYTASAIASFAFNLPTAVVDGNVYRVLSRYFGIATPIDSSDGKQQFSGLANQLLDPKQSAHYNQAIMDLGATVCTPKSPDCSVCPLEKHCIARAQQLTGLLPVKEKKITVRRRYFNFFLFLADDMLWIRKRSSKDIWENLHEPFLAETDEKTTLSALKKDSILAMLREDILDIRKAGHQTQRLTHQLIDSTFYYIQLHQKSKLLPEDGFWVPISELQHYAFPKTLVTFFEQINP